MNHKGSIKLESKRLILRALKESDAEEVFKNWTNDDEVSKYMRWTTHKNVEETKKWLREEEQNCKNKDYYTWAVTLKETGEIIGNISALPRIEESRYEIGYGFGKKYWRKGYATESLKCIMEFLINEVGIKRFKCAHAKLNPASGAVMQKVGFRYAKDDCYETFDKTRKVDAKIYYLDIDDKIVKAKKEDATSIEEIIKAGWQTAYRGLINDDYLNNIDIKIETERCKEKLENNNEIYIYKENNEVKGVIRFEKSETKNYGEVFALYVKVEEKRKGVGTKLLNFAKQELIKQMYPKMVIWCLKGNNQGINFYKKNGGKEFGERKACVKGIIVDEIGFEFKLLMQ